MIKFKKNKDENKKEEIKNKPKKKRDNENSPSFTLIEVIVIVLITAVVVSISSGLLIFNNYEKLSANSSNLKNSKYKEEIIETFDKITEDYVEKIDKDELANSAIEGMFEYLGDPYSSYLDKSQTEELTETLDGTYNGVGIEITNSDEKIKITRVFDHTPAKEAGIKKDDIIIKVDDIDLNDKNANYLSNYIKYKSKKKIKLEIQRNNKTKKVTLTKTKIDYPVIYSEKYNKTGYVYISAFSKTSAEQFESTVKSLEEDGIKNLVIDLRGNTGGYLNAAYDIAEQFLIKGKVVYQLKDKKDTKKYKTTNPDKKSYKVAILIDRRSASASEVLALALKENYNAILVGEKSYGKGSVQQTNQLENGSMVKYTTAKWLSPSGKSIDGIGITPDINVVYSEGTNGQLDSQLKKAIELIN